MRSDTARRIAGDIVDWRAGAAPRPDGAGQSPAKIFGEGGADRRFFPPQIRQASPRRRAGAAPPFLVVLGSRHGQ